MAAISIDPLPPDVRAYWNYVEFQKRVYARLDQLDVRALVRRIERTGPHDRDLAELKTIWVELVELVKRDIEQPLPWTPSKWVMARVEWIRRFAVEKAGLDLKPPQQEQTPEVGTETVPPIPPPPPPETPPPRIHKIEVEAETAPPPTPPLSPPEIILPVLEPPSPPSLPEEPNPIPPDEEPNPIASEQTLEVRTETPPPVLSPEAPEEPKPAPSKPRKKHRQRRVDAAHKAVRAIGDAWEKRILDHLAEQALVKPDKVGEWRLETVLPKQIKGLELPPESPNKSSRTLSLDMAAKYLKRLRDKEPTRRRETKVRKKA